MSLARKAMRSAAWVALRMGGRQLANVVIFFILAALLTPEKVGVAALGANFAVFLIPAVTRGIRDSIIQREDLDNAFLSAALLNNTLLGALLSLGLLGLGAFAGQLFDEPALGALVTGSAPIPLIAAIGSVYEAVLEREFRHKQVSFIHVFGSLASIPLVGLTLWAGAGIWALVVFNLASYTLTTLAMILLADWKPRTRPSRVELGHQARFALPIICSQTIAIGMLRVVEVLIGFFLSSASVAFFRLGSNFVRLLNQFFMAPIAQVLLPTFSRSTESPSEAFPKSITATSVVLFPVFLGTAALLPIVIPTLFGPEWSSSVAMGMILCLGVLGPVLTPAAYAMLIARGKGGRTALLTVAELVFAVATVSAGAQINGTWAAVGFVARLVLMVPLVLWVMHRDLGVSARRVLGTMLPFLALAGVMLVVLILGLAPVSAGWPVGLRIAAAVTLGLGIYLLGFRLLGPRFFAAQYALVVSFVPGRLARLF